MGVPPGAALRAECDDEALAEFERAIQRFDLGGARIREVDWAPFREAGEVVFGGPMLAERYAAVGDFVTAHRSEVDPAVASIIAAAASFDAVGLLRQQYRLRALQTEAARIMAGLDILATPTAPLIPTIEEVRKDPIAMNSRMGSFTYFGNPLNLCAVSVPFGLRGDGLPFGLCLYARKNADAALLEIAGRYGDVEGRPLGAAGSRSGRQSLA